jgi:transcriptional regulator with XRE-family HTH domain
MQINLSHLRDRLGLTLEQMAGRLPYSVSMLSRWENGKSNIPSGNLPALAKAYGCRVQDIFSDDGPPAAIEARPFVPSEAVLRDLLKDVQQELPAALPYAEWPRSAASALHMRLARLADAPATGASPAPRTARARAVAAPPPPPTKPGARA